MIREETQKTSILLMEAASVYLKCQVKDTNQCIMYYNNIEIDVTDISDTRTFWSKFSGVRKKL